MPLRSIARFSKAAARGVELPLHQPVHDMDQCHGSAALGEAIGGLDAEETAADDRDPAPVARRILERRHIGEIAEGDHTRQVHAGCGQAHGVRTRGKHGAIEGEQLSSDSVATAPFEIEPFDAPAGQELNALRAVPVGVAQGYVGFATSPASRAESSTRL